MGAPEQYGMTWHPAIRGPHQRVLPTRRTTARPATRSTTRSTARPIVRSTTARRDHTPYDGCAHVGEIDEMDHSDGRVGLFQPGQPAPERRGHACLPGRRVHHADAL